MTLNKKRNLVVIVVGILIIAVILSSFIYLNTQGEQQNLASLTIGMEPNQTNLLVYVAQNQSYFQNNGLNVTIKTYPSGAAATTGMLNGEVNLASATEFVLARNILANGSLQTIASISKFTHVYLIANKSSGIQNASDLIGKRIGLTLKTNSEFFIGRFLQLNNLGLSQVNLINVPTAQYLDVLRNGTVDAVVAWQPYPATIESQLGSSNVVMWDVQSGQPGYENILGTSSLISNHPDLVNKFLAALIKAQDYIAGNPSMGQAIAVNGINFTSQYVQATWPNYLFAISLDQPLLLAMQDESTWMISNNITNATSLPNFLTNVYIQGLESIKPSSVTIIH